MFSMKKIIVLACLLGIIACTGKPENLPSHRLRFPDLNVSYLTPDNWYIRKIPGNDNSVVYTDLDYGINPNIQVEIITDKSYSIDEYIQKQKMIYKDYTLVAVSEFKTNRGHIVEKIEIRRVNNKQIPLSQFYYYIKIKGTVFQFTATCPEVTIEKYKHIFDLVLKTVES